MLRYSFKEPEPPDLILIATGTEVHICARAADLLEAEGIATRVVSMPCMENFAAQDAEYREQRAAAGVPRPRVGRGGEPRSAGANGWASWGRSIGMETLRRVRSGRRAVQALRVHAGAGRGQRAGRS